MATTKDVAVLHEKLLEAQRKGDAEASLRLTQELRQGPQHSHMVRRQRLAAQTQRKEVDSDDPQDSKRRRLVFIDLNSLETCFQVQKFPLEELERSFVILHKRYKACMTGEPIDWSERNRSRTTLGPGPPIHLSNEFASFLRKKDDLKTIFWMSAESDRRKGGTMEDLSKWLYSKMDERTGNWYNPLKLSATFWRKRFPSEHNIPQFTRSGEKVLRNLLANGTEPTALGELISQSNPSSLRVVLLK